MPTLRDTHGPRNRLRFSNGMRTRRRTTGRFPRLRKQMKIATALMITAVALFGVARTPGAQRPCSDYDFDIRLFPAFDLPSKVSIAARAGVAQLAITYGNARIVGHRSERLTLSSSTSEAFCRRLLQLVAVAQERVARLVVDGIAVDGTFREETSLPYLFSFHSPNPHDHPRDYGIVDAVFTVFEATPVSCELNESLELLSLYFSFGPPWRTVSQTPYTVRFWGSFSVSHHKELAGFLASLPQGKPVALNLTNWDSEGTLPLPFQDLRFSGRQVRWIVPSKWAGSLTRLGVDPAHIEVHEGPYCTQPRTRFARH